MKKSPYHIRLGILFAGLMLAVALSAGQAWAKGKAKSAPPPPSSQHTSHYWTIGSVDANSSTVMLQKSDNSTNLTLSVTGATKISVDGKPGKLADVQSGMKAVFSASGNVCSSLSVSAAPPPADKKSSKKQKK